MLSPTDLPPSDTWLVPYHVVTTIRRTLAAIDADAATPDPPAHATRSDHAGMIAARVREDLTARLLLGLVRTETNTGPREPQTPDGRAVLARREAAP